MRVAVFTDSYLPQVNGVVTQIRNIYRELSLRGHEIMIIAPSPHHEFIANHDGSIEEFFLPSIALPTYRDYRISHFSQPRVFSRLKKFRPDLIHVHTPFGVGWLGLWAARKLGVPLVGTYHTLIPEFLDYLPIPFIKKTGFAKAMAWAYTNHFYNKCNIVTTPTLQMKRELEKNGVAKEVVVLSNAIDFDCFNRHAKKNWRASKGGKTSLVYFGRVGFEKNIDVLLPAVKHLLWKDKSIELTITGHGPAEKYLKEIVQDEKLDAHVCFQHSLRHGELPKHLALQDIFLTASTIETQGLTVLEAMAIGLPCIGPDYLGIKASIKDGKNGFLFRPFDFVDCARKIGRLAHSEKLRKKFALEGFKTAKKHSVETIASETEGLYKKVIRLQAK